MKSLISFFVFLLIANIATAQTPATIDSIAFQVNPVFSKNPFPQAGSDKNTSANLSVYLSTDNDVVKIKVKLGSSNGAADILEKEFSFVNNGTTFVLSNNTAFINLGKFTQTGTYYAEVKLQYTDGTYSPSISAQDN